MAKNPNWTREELILAFNLYLKLPFGKMHKGNEDVIKLADLLGRRTPSSVSMRLTNFASVDPYHQQRGVKGMDGGHKQVEPIWNEFINNQEELVYESERLLAEYQNQELHKLHPNIKFDWENLQGEMRKQVVMSRVNQNVFRQMILKTYKSTCAVSEINIPDLLVAGHIIPWSVGTQHRVNPENGICLSNLYDRAYENGLICIDTDYKILISKRLKEESTKEFYQLYFGRYEYKQINLPIEYKPRRDLLQYRLDRFEY